MDRFRVAVQRKVLSPKVVVAQVVDDLARNQTVGAGIMGEVKGPKVVKEVGVGVWTVGFGHPLVPV